MLAAFALLSWQLLLPGFIGLANNGDFLKVAGRQSLNAIDSDHSTFSYFQPEWIRDPQFHWDSGLPSSENVFAWIASEIERHVSDPTRFDIRWIGAIHMLGWLGGYCLLLRTLRNLKGWRWWIAVLASLWIFMDVAWVSQFNTFLMDVAAMLALMTAIPAAIVLLQRPANTRAPMIMIFGSAMLLYVLSKGQHALLAPVPIFFMILIGRSAPGRERIAAFATAGIVLAGAIWISAVTPAWYRDQSRFNLVFYRILPHATAPAEVAAELGLAPSDLQFVGMHSFLPESPATKLEWSREFDKRGGYGSVAKYYVHHPAVTFGFLWKDLREVAFQIRSENLSNFRQQAGMPAGAMTTRMATWSDLRRWMFIRLPAHMPLWYALLLFGGSWLAIRTHDARTQALIRVIVFVAFMGLIEFLIASLTDSLDTSRHLLLFQLLTDFTLFYALVWSIDEFPTRVLSHRAPAAGARDDSSAPQR